MRPNHLTHASLLALALSTPTAFAASDLVFSADVHAEKGFMQILKCQNRDGTTELLLSRIDVLLTHGEEEYIWDRAGLVGDDRIVHVGLEGLNPGTLINIVDEAGNVVGEAVQTTGEISLTLKGQGAETVEVACLSFDLP